MLTTVLIYLFISIYLDELLDGGGLLELNLGDSSDGEQVLETVGDGVGRRGHSRVADGQRKCSHIGNTSHELFAEVLWFDVQDGWREDGTGIVDLHENKLI